MKYKTSIVWQGISALDNVTPIVVLLVPDSGNIKTGAMWQTYILQSGVKPLDAIKAKNTSSTCGTCPLQQGGCYAERSKGLISIGQRIAAYPTIAIEDACEALTASGASLRIGAYGDPAAVPVSVWASLTRAAKGYTGYTHQWRSCDPALQEYVMASADSYEDADNAQAMGWRTFRVRQVSASGMVEPVRANERVCPASHERDITTCADCRLCDGLGRGAMRPNVAIADHSTRALALRRKFLTVLC